MTAKYTPRQQYPPTAPPAGPPTGPPTCPQETPPEGWGTAEERPPEE